MDLHPNDLSPQLSQPDGSPSSDAPSLGGDRKSCPTHPAIRMHQTLFGDFECPQCAMHPTFTRPVVTRAPLPGDPVWFSAGSTTPETHIRHVRAGLHPFGIKLSSDPESRCGNCQHLIRGGKYAGANTYFKCGLMRDKWTAGPATDLRRKWHGCDQWRPDDETLRAAAASSTVQAFAARAAERLVELMTLPEDEE